MLHLIHDYATVRPPSNAVNDDSIPFSYPQLLRPSTYTTINIDLDPMRPLQDVSLQEGSPDGGIVCVPVDHFSLLIFSDRTIQSVRTMLGLPMILIVNNVD